jgi:hypothetical protein
MFIKNFTCPQCKNDSLEPSSEKTIESYIENDFDKESLIISLEGTPPKRPGYIIFKCILPECGTIVKYSEEEILKKLIDDWTDLAWKAAKHYAMHYYQFEDHKTRFLYDDRVQKFIKDGDIKYLDSAELYRDFAKFLKNEKKERTK